MGGAGEAEEAVGRVERMAASSLCAGDQVGGVGMQLSMCAGESPAFGLSYRGKSG